MNLPDACDSARDIIDGTLNDLQLTPVKTRGGNRNGCTAGLEEFSRRR